MQQINKHRNIRLLPVILGLIAPIIFFSLVLGLGPLEPGFSHATDMMSLLRGVGGIRGTVFLLGEALTGLIIIAFAVGHHYGINDGRGSKVGPILLSLSGVGMIGSAIFHGNTGCKNILVDPTMAGKFHILFAFITGSYIAISPLVIFFRMKDNNWTHLRLFTLIFGILANIPGLILWISFFTTRIPEFEGLIQRLGIIFPMIWVGVMSFNLVKLDAINAT